MQSHCRKKSQKNFLITTQLIYRQIISVKTNLTYRTYGLLTTNQSSYLKQEIKFKRNLTGPDSFTYPLFHSFIYSLFHSFIHSFIHLSIHPSIHPFIHSFIHSFIHPSIHPSIHPFIHSFIHSFVYSSFTPALIHFSLLYTDMLSCFLTNLYDLFNQRISNLFFTKH